MRKKFAVLHKKLEELESEVNVNLPTDIQSRQLLDWRISFLRSLLSAELESHPTKPHHLHHIDQRLAELETKFRGWDNFQPFSPLNHIDAASSCSCTESCLNDDDDGQDNDMGDSAELTFYEYPEFVSEGEKKQEMEALAEKVQVEDPEFVSDGEKKAEKVQVEDPEFKKQKVETRDKKVQVEESVKKERKQHRNRMYDEFMNGMLVLGLLGVVIALTYRACCGCAKAMEMEMEGFLRPT